MKKILLIPCIFLFQQSAFSQSLPADLKVQSQGKSPGSGLKLKSSKVPQYDLINKKSTSVQVGAKKININLIPKLDIGEEKTLEFNAVDLQFSPAPQNRLSQVKIENVAPIKIDTILKQPLKKAFEITQAALKSNLAPQVDPLKEIADPSVNQPDPKEKKTIQFSENDYKLMHGLIFQETRKNYPIALGIFSQLQKDPKLKNEATYQLALSSYHLKMYSEFRAQMLSLLNDKNWQKSAVIKLVENLDRDGLNNVPAIDKALAQLDLEITKDIEYNIIRARYYQGLSNLTMANDALEQIEKKDPKNPELHYLKSLMLYGSGQLDKAIETLEPALDTLEKTNNNPELKSLAAITMARFYFQKSQFQDSYKSYLKIDKNHSLWLQSLIEQAWAQILVKDYEGAAGNMFSLHTAYFKGAFKPESYIVRTVGYLNLCQYGDGLKVLENMRRAYVPYVARLEKYQKENSKDSAYYETVKNWLRSPQQKEVDGLPRGFIAEMASHPSFLNQQMMLNNLEDQNSSFLNITKEVVNLERAYTQQISESQSNIGKLEEKMSKTKDETAKLKIEEEITQLKNLIFSLKEQQNIIRSSRNSLKELREASMTRIESEKAKIRSDISAFLKTRYKVLADGLIQQLDQSDILQYEIYSGAGEHLRYQMAGGDIKEKENIELKPEKDKSMKWRFQGEIWEDEIGHFRSSLKNVCAEVESAN